VLLSFVEERMGCIKGKEGGRKNKIDARKRAGTNIRRLMEVAVAERETALPQP
jgi:hypothetical protein